MALAAAKLLGSAAARLPCPHACSRCLAAYHPAHRFKVVDTSGLEPFLPGDTIQARATALTARVLNRSDVALLLIDGQ